MYHKRDESSAVGMMCEETSNDQLRLAKGLCDEMSKHQEGCAMNDWQLSYFQQEIML